MPSSAFLSALGAANVQSVILMQLDTIQSVQAVTSTQAEWSACSPLTGWDATSIPGSVVPSATTYNLTAYSESARQNLSVGYARGTYRIANPHGHIVGPYNITVTLTLQKNGVDQETATSTFYMPRQYGTSYTADVYFIFVNEISYSAGDLIAIKEPYDWAHDIVGDGTIVYHSGGSRFNLPLVLGTRTLTGTLTTGAMDLGAIPETSATVNFDDFIPPLASVTYTAEGSDNGSSWTSLGTVTDGDSLSAYRYYRVTAAHSWSGADYPEIREIRVSSDDGSYAYYSTHRDEPLFGALPYLTDKPIGTISSKIALLDKSTTGEASVKMAWNDHTSALLAAGTLINKPVSIYVGAKGLSLTDYELIFTGSTHDYSVDTDKGEVTIKLRDSLKMFSVAKVPRESTNATTGLRTVRPLVFSTRNIVDAIIDICDAQGIPERFIDRAAFTALTIDNVVTRTINEPTEADKLVAELAATAGIFIVPYPNGKITPVIYNKGAEPVATLDAKVIDFGSIDGGLKDVRTRQVVYYSPISTSEPGEDSSGYTRGIIYVNVATESQLMGGEVSEKRWFDKWSTYNLTSLVNQMYDWFSTPHMTIKANKIPLNYMGINPGSVVSVDNLPIPSATWPGLTSGRRFLVIGRDIDASSLTLNLSLYDLGVSGLNGAGVIGTDLAISGTETPSGQTNTYTVTGGTATYAWETTLGTLSSTTGSSVNLNVSDLTGDGTISVSDATHKMTMRFSILPTQVYNFLLTQQPDGTRQFSWTALAAVIGYQIRYKSGTGNLWDDMTPLHDGTLVSSPWETNQLASGTYTFAICALNASGSLSTAVSYIEATLTEQRGNFKLSQENAALMSWPGTQTDCHEDESGILVPNDATTWNDMGTWAASTTWSPAPESPIVYEHTVIDVGGVTSFTPIITTVADGTVTVTMATSTDDVTYSAFGAVGFVESNRYIKIKVSVAGDRPTLSQLDILLSARPVDDMLEDVVTSSLTGNYRIGTGDIRLPLGVTFQSIKVVSVTLQNVGAGWSWELIDKTPTYGPRIKIYNASNTPADATIDALVRGI